MSDTIQIKVPDIGSSADVEVIEVLVNVGDTIEEDDSLITLESDKASMEIPATAGGTVSKVCVSVGDKVSEGAVIVELGAAAAAGASAAESAEPSAAPETSAPEVKAPAVPAAAPAQSAPAQPTPPPAAAPAVPASTSGLVYASPTVRRLAREFGVDLSLVQGSGRKSRILKEDVQAYVKAALASGPSAPVGAAGGASIPGLNLAPPVDVDFAKFGPIEVKPLNKIKRLTGMNLARNWLTIPHVTQFDEADISRLEAFRQKEKKAALDKGVRLTPLAFIMKAVVASLKEYPQFNSSLDASGEALVFKDYFHIGVAVETPNGLVVPVIRDADKKGVMDIAREMGEISLKAREKGLMPKDMEGATFTISSLGGIGGTAFTPIVNAPNVAILGVSKSFHKPVYNGKQFKPRLMLPLSLSYDHRVIDGAEAARFTQSLASYLGDIRQMLL